METESSSLAHTKAEKAGGDGGLGEISGRIERTKIEDIKHKRGIKHYITHQQDLLSRGCGGDSRGRRRGSVWRGGGGGGGER